MHGFFVIEGMTLSGHPWIINEIYLNNITDFWEAYSLAKMFSTDFIFRQQCQAGFRPLCNKILI